MASTAIEVHDLHKSHDGQLVPGGLSFAVAAGEIIGIARPNGADKTTTVEILQRLRSRDARRRRRARAQHRPRTQATASGTWFTSADLIASGLTARRRSAGPAGRARRRQSRRALAESWHLSRVLRKPYGTLSGRQRHCSSLSRIKEAHDHGLSNEDAVAVGLQRTGAIVTAAAILLAVALGAFVTSQLVFLKELGVGAAAAVLIDAFIVRALLVPALMLLLGNANWWSPRLLARLHERVGVTESTPRRRRDSRPPRP